MLYVDVDVDAFEVGGGGDSYQRVELPRDVSTRPKGGTALPLPLLYRGLGLGLGAALEYGVGDGREGVIGPNKIDC